MAPPPPKRLLSKEDAPGAPEWLERLLGPLNAFINPAATALTQGLTFRENFAGEVRTLTLTPPDDWYAFGAADMRGAWQLYPSTAAPTPAYRLAVRKDVSGMVEVRGLAIPPAVGTLGVAFAWPAGYAPHQEEIFTLRGEQQTVEVRPKASGADVTVRNLDTGGAPAQGWVSFSGLRFEAADRSPPRWATPVDLKLGTPQRPFPGRPGSVQVLRAVVQGNLTAPAVVTTLDAEIVNLERAKASPGVRIHRVWGLQPGVRYTLTLLVLPE